MRRSLLNKRILPKPLRQALILIILLLLPSATWADITYGGQALTFNYTSDTAPSYYYSGSGDNKVIEWNAKLNGSGAYESSYSGYYEFTDLRLTYANSLTGLLSNITIGAGNGSALQNATIKVYKLTVPDETNGTLIGTISNEGTTYTYIPTDGVKVFNNEYIQLAIESTGDNQRFFVNQIKSISLTFSGTGISVDGIQQGTVSFTPASGDDPAVLTLNGATIKGNIISSIQALTISLVESSTLNGNISLNEDQLSEGSLTFSGNGSLTINNELPAISKFTEVNLNGFKIASNSYGVYWSNDYRQYKNNDGFVSNMTITKEEVYPIWVYTGTQPTGYTQLTAANSSVTIMQDDSPVGTVSYSNSTLILSNCNYSTVGDGHAFYIGEGLSNLNVHLTGTNIINGSGFSFPNTNNNAATLTFTTDNTNPGSLTISGSSFTDRDVKVHCENPLGYDGKKVSTDWTRLKIGDTPIAETSINGVSFDTSDNTLTLNGATIDGNIISNLEALTINFQGTNTINGSLYLNNQIDGTLAFTGSNDGSLTINKPGNSAIYNFQSVDFGGFNLATTSSPGIYYDDDLRTLSSNNIMGQASNVTLTKKTVYPLWIGTHKSSYFQEFTQVTEDNKTGILGDSKISFDGEHTLTLSEATITGSIISGLSSLNIIVDKANSIQCADDSATCIRNIAPGATLTLQKSNSETASSLTVQGGHFIRDFKSISYSEGGLNLSAYNYEGTPISDVYYANNDFQTSSNNNIFSVKFSNEDPSFLVKIGNTPITEPTTINAIDDENDDILGEVGSVTLSVDENNNNILTIESIETGGADIVSTLPNLTIKYKGSCNIGKIISTYSNAPLTFGWAEGASNEDKFYLSLSNELPWKGFSGNPTFNNKLVYIPGSDSHYIKVLNRPNLSNAEGIYSGDPTTITVDGEEIEIISFYYTIDYADESKADVTTPQKYNPDNPFTISEPATLSVNAHYSYKGMEQDSENAIGKYFGFAESMVLTTLASETEEKEIVLPALLPATEENDGITFELSSGNENIIYKNNDSKWMIKGYGNASISAMISSSDITVLNEVAELDVTVLHEPTFTAYYGEDNTKVYDGNGSGNVSVKISNSDNLGSEYTLMYYLGTDNTTPTPYKEPISLNATTTVNAFIRYVNSDNSSITYDSEPVSMEYLVSQKLDTPEFEGSINFQTCYLEDYSLAKPTGLKVYIITEISLTDNTLKAVSIDYIPRYVPVLLEKEGETPEGGYVAETYTGEVGEFSNNMLQYTEDDKDVTDTEFVLFNNEFVKATGIIAAGHCFLSLDEPHANTRGFSIDTSGNGTTGINNASLHDSREVMTKQWYDLQGRKIQQPTKAGLYIMNGKKVVIK